RAGWTDLLYLYRVSVVTFLLGVLAVVVSLLALALHVWWAAATDRRPPSDVPALLLDAAVHRLPDEHRDWGAAMVAELSQIGRPAARWGFAAAGPPGPRLAPPAR